MDNEVVLYAFATVGSIVLAFAGIFAIRHKHVPRGLLMAFVLLFSFMLAFGLIGSLYLYNHYMPEQIQIGVGEFFSIVGPLTMSAIFFFYLRRLKIVGNLDMNGQAKNASLSQVAAMLLCVYCAISLLVAVNEDEVVKLNVFWWIVAICLLLFFYYSTKWGEKGFVYRGKAVPFTDIVHARWESQGLKTKLKIKLINNEQELALSVPAEMTPAIDNYLRANFPNP